MDTLTLARYEAQGNDFLIALLAERELRELDASLNARGLARSDVARAVCDRHVGLGTEKGYVHSGGADGFIMGMHDASDGQPAGRIRMHLLNADGSFAETSGNGLACLAHASVDDARISDGEVPFETDAGPQHCTIFPGVFGPGNRSGVVRRYIEVAMRPVSGGPAIPAELEERIRSDFGDNLRHFGTGDVGNPHLVVAVSRPPVDCPPSELSNHAAELGNRVVDLGRAYEAYFPTGINVEFIWPHAPDPSQTEQAALQMSVWERGAGLTVSCGSGSVVAATLAHRWGFTDTASDSPQETTAASHGPALRSSLPVEMLTAPFPHGPDRILRYTVIVEPTPHDDLASTSAGDSPVPRLGVYPTCVETGITCSLDQVPDMLDDLAALAPSQR